MDFVKKHKNLLFFIILISFFLKLFIICNLKNNLNLASDDVNYIKSATVLVKRGIFIFYGFNDPTVFVMPGYPYFVAAVFKLFGYGLTGLQTVRIIQAVISSLTIFMIYKIAELLADSKTGLIAGLIVAFYLPNIFAVGYILTETIFTAVLCTLIFLSHSFSNKPGVFKFIILGSLWAVSTLIRPTIALYPLFLFAYLIITKKINLKNCIRYSIIMLSVFIIFLLPWWIRNYNEYSDFIPLTAASGNPLLQGTYINYIQTEKSNAYYVVGKNSYEINKNELNAAKVRLVNGFKNDFVNYLGWYLIGKTIFFWGSPFYWKSYFKSDIIIAFIWHYSILITAILGLKYLKRDLLKYSLIIFTILYINIVHCYFIAFDRYAFPVMPLASVFSAVYIRNRFIKFN